MLNQYKYIKNSEKLSLKFKGKKEYIFIINLRK